MRNSFGKTCKKCLEHKPWSEFSQKNQIGRANSYQPRCKPCASEDTRAWRESKSIDELKDQYLQRTYGVTLQWYQDTLSLQHNQCPICTKSFIFQGKLGPDSPVVDHDHKDGRVRGIICNECNRGLEYFRDNIKALRTAANYIEGSKF
jgi:hypothetical protein